MAPPSTFDSFDASALGAFSESALRARGGAAVFREIYLTRSGPNLDHVDSATGTRTTLGGSGRFTAGITGVHPSGRFPVAWRQSDEIYFGGDMVLDSNFSSHFFVFRWTGTDWAQTTWYIGTATGDAAGPPTDALVFAGLTYISAHPQGLLISALDNRAWIRVENGAAVWASDGDNDGNRNTRNPYALTEFGGILHASGLLVFRDGADAYQGAAKRSGAWGAMGPLTSDPGTGAALIARLGSDTSYAYFAHTENWTYQYNANPAEDVAITKIGRWDGSVMDSIGEAGWTPSSRPVAYGSLLAIGGGSSVRTWNGSAWATLATSNGTVNDLAVIDGNLYAAGNFFTIGGETTGSLAVYDGANWSAGTATTANFNVLRINYI